MFSMSSFDRLIIYIVSLIYSVLVVISLSCFYSVVNVERQFRRWELDFHKY